MIWIPVCIIVLFVMCMVATIQGYSYDGIWITILKTIGGAFASAIIGTILGFIIAIIMGVFLFAAPTEDYQDSKQAIYSVRDSTSLSGGFVLGTGMVNSELKIYYIVETEYGKQIQSRSKEDVYIKESDEEAPSLEVISKRYEHRWLKWIAVCLDGIHDVYIITVPTDTIEVQYSIDMN